MATATVLARRDQLQNSRTNLSWERGPTFAALPTFTSFAETASAFAFAFTLGLTFTETTFTTALAHRLPQVALGVRLVKDR